MKYTLQQLAELTGSRLQGDGGCVITSVASIEDAGEGSIVFFKSSRYRKFLVTTGASAIITTEEFASDLSLPVLIAANPRAVYARVTALLYPQQRPLAGIHDTAVIHPQASVPASAHIGAHVVIEAGAEIGEGVIVESGCVIGRGSRIGDHTWLHAQVTVYAGCTLGQHCEIHSSSVIGADGFGFEYDGQEWVKIPHIGGVIIGDHVEIGACSTVDRGSLKDTIIGNGVKLDNHVQIGHNVRVGDHTVMANGVGIAGSTIIGHHCIIGGMTGVKDNIEVTDNVMITGMSLVSKPLTQPGSYSSNTPIDDTRTWRKNSARFRQLDELAKRIIELEKKVDKE